MLIFFFTSISQKIHTIFQLIYCSINNMWTQLVITANLVTYVSFIMTNITYTSSSYSLIFIFIKRKNEEATQEDENE